MNIVQNISSTIRNRLKANDVRFHASDNISEYIDQKKELPLLVDEATKAFEVVLQSLVIDTENDPNSKDTARRLAKMYINELMAGRYVSEPEVRGFPNTDPETRFAGLIMVQCDVKSVCSHHWQPVTGTAYIGILPSTAVIGLSKYQRIVTWLSRRGTLQEELTRNIAKSIIRHTKSEDVGVVIKATHGCCSNRGIMTSNSMTTTTSLHGQFFGQALRSEFLSQIPVG